MSEQGTSTLFILFAQPRTGSTFVINELSNHPHILCYGALFGKNPRLWANSDSRSVVGRLREGLGPEWATLDYRIEHWRTLLDHLPKVPRRIPAAMRRRGVGVPAANVFGIKHMMQREDPILAGLSKDPTVKAVVLERRNFLASYSSVLVALTTGQWHARGEQSVKTAKVVFNGAEFDRIVEKRSELNKNYKESLAGAGDRALFLEYNEIRAAVGIDRIIRFLGAEPLPTEGVKTEGVKLIKRNSDDILSRFENPDAVRAHLDKIGKPEWASEAPVTA